MLSTVFADITPVKNLTVRAQFGADYAHSTSFMKSYPSYIINNNSGRAGRSSSDILNLTETLTANYRWALNEDHSFNFMLGQEGIDYRSTGFQVVTRGQTIDRLTNVTAGTRASSWQDANTAHSFMSFSSVPSTITKICIMRKLLHVQMPLPVLVKIIAGGFLVIGLYVEHKKRSFLERCGMADWCSD